jgi:hypothetical protein
MVVWGGQKDWRQKWAIGGYKIDYTCTCGKIPREKGKFKTASKN